PTTTLLAGFAAAQAQEKQYKERPACCVIGHVGKVVSGASRGGIARQSLNFEGMRPSKRTAKWFRACFQPTMGIVHFFDAWRIASQISFPADSALGYCFLLLVNFLITLFTDSIALVV